MTAAPPLLVGMAGGKPRPRRERMSVPKELSLHIAIATLLRDHCLPDWRWHHVPNGECRDHRTAAKLKAMGVRPGAPDFEIFAPGGQLHVLELKRAGARLTDGQKELVAWCIKTSVPHAVAYSMDQVLEVLDLWGCLRIKIASRKASP